MEPSKETYMILWPNSSELGEYEILEGNLEDAIKAMKRNHRYDDYGRRGGVIVRAKPVYQIQVGPIERFLDS